MGNLVVRVDESLMRLLMKPHTVKLLN